MERMDVKEGSVKEREREKCWMKKLHFVKVISSACPKDLCPLCPLAWTSGRGPHHGIHPNNLTDRKEKFDGKLAIAELKSRYFPHFMIPLDPVRLTCPSVLG